MPTYEYSCKQCGQHLEVVQSFKDDALTVCALCGGELRKVFGSVGIVFKGSGFYKTDSRTSNGASRAAEKSDKTEKSDKSEKSEKSGADTSSGTAAKSDTGTKSDSAPAKSDSSSTSTSSASTSTPAAAAS